MSHNSSETKTMLISFSGIDGAGKSTQIQNLTNHLEAAGLRVSVITFWDDVVTLKALREGAGHKVFKGDKGVGSPEAPIHRKDKNVRSPLMTLLRMGFYFFDALSLRHIVNQSGRSDVEVIIFDRYLFDELANLNLDNRLIQFYVKALLRLAPKPTVSFVLDADPVQAFARKPEYPLEFLHSNRSSYLRLNEITGGVVIPPSTIEAAKAAVVAHVQPVRSGTSPVIHGRGPAQHTIS